MKNKIMGLLLAGVILSSISMQTSFGAVTSSSAEKFAQSIEKFGNVLWDNTVTSFMWRYKIVSFLMFFAGVNLFGPGAVTLHNKMFNTLLDNVDAKDKSTWKNAFNLFYRVKINYQDKDGNEIVTQKKETEFKKNYASFINWQCEIAKNIKNHVVKNGLFYGGLSAATFFIANNPELLKNISEESYKNLPSTLVKLTVAGYCWNKLAEDLTKKTNNLKDEYYIAQTNLGIARLEQFEEEKKLTESIKMDDFSLREETVQERKSLVNQSNGSLEDSNEDGCNTTSNN